MKNEEIIQKWLRNELTDADKQILIDSGDWEELQRMMKALSNFRAPEFNVEEQLSVLQSKQHRKASKQRWLLPVFRVAAAVLLLISAYAVFFNNPLTEYQTRAGEALSFYLPDSTQVDMNAESSVSYSKNEWQAQRTVNLQGEAYFDVIPGSVFDVNTSNGIIRVVGTEFNIRSRDNYFEVTCYEGKVSVIRGKTAELLTPGERVRVFNGQLTLDKIELEPARNGIQRYEESHFKSVPLFAVVDELSRQFDIEIELNNQKRDIVFTGAFTHENLELALRAVCIPLDLNFEISENRVIIK
ncbi:FecR family protein [Fulvivirga sedimenti]|uniref:FecR domain-containing protein n=1 Tax=Fulvivirga sedimenti TaxID=2879465 RepID=A0A9X1HRZ4_9BACT|nr:FecR domain-containing protein [Fulvivirga sedimenti]MCA6074525.1 FecR domain-containing protein [Fulvivirga sedimenti]MCA6075702.1 FecR domain-containing protein [Fulvivirga sedimenti]MCA6076830.1 FecR domain-containing protein [Fulvivirga sedimenti]